MYLRMTNTDGGVHAALVRVKTKVAPIKWMIIPRLELCVAHLMAQMLHHVKGSWCSPQMCSCLDR